MVNSTLAPMVLDTIDLVGQNHDFVNSDVIEEHSHSLCSTACRTWGPATSRSRVVQFARGSSQGVEFLE